MAHLKPSRVLEPAYAPTKLERSSALEIAQSGSLEAFLDEREPLEGPDERGRREELLLLLRGMFREWIAEVGVANGTFMDVDAARASGGVLLVSGSYRLGVCVRDSDLDTVCLAPRHVTSDDFFSTFVEKLRAAAGVTHLLPIPDASVPIIELQLHGIAFDLQLVVLPTSTVSESFNFLDDGVLATIEDERAVKSLNGPRVNELIHRAVPPRSPFVTLLRALRLWGRARGLYSNKMGFWGGVNFAIVAAFVCQQHPNQTAATALLLRFFETMATWPWPKAIMLHTPYELSPQDDVWNPVDNPRNRRDVMPIITPAYPAMNSSFAVLECTKAVMQAEFKRGLALCRRVLSSPSEHIPTAAWAELFAPCTFFLRYEHYLVLDITTSDPAHMPAWKGFVESRIRSLMEFIQNERMPFTSICPYPSPIMRMEDVPVPVPVIVAAAAAATTTTTVSDAAPSVPEAPPDAQQSHDAAEDSSVAPTAQPQPLAAATTTVDSASDATAIEAAPAVPDASPTPLKREVYTYFIGIAIHKERAKDKKLDLSATLAYFKQTLKAWRGYQEGMDVRQRMMTWKQLPDEVFPQSRAAAEAARQAMIAAAMARSATASTAAAPAVPEANRRRNEVWQRSSAGAHDAPALAVAPSGAASRPTFEAAVPGGIPGLNPFPVAVAAAAAAAAASASVAAASSITAAAAGTKRRMEDVKSVIDASNGSDEKLDAARKVARTAEAAAPVVIAAPTRVDVLPARIVAVPPHRRPRLAVVLKQ